MGWIVCPFTPTRKQTGAPEPSFSEGGLTPGTGCLQSSSVKVKRGHTGVWAVIQPGWLKQAKGEHKHANWTQRARKAPRSRGVPQEGRHQDGENSRDFPGSTSCWHTSLGLLTPQAVRQHISLVLICPICDALLQQPQELHRKCAFLPPN